MRPDTYPLPIWRSVEERLGIASGSAQGEFPSGASVLDPIARRDFVKLLGATAALAGAACSRPPTEVMLAYQHQPEGLTPGDPLHYATTLSFGGVVTPVLATAREGRPIKLEGNPQQPTVRGALGPFEQAQLLSLYDPHRAQLVKHRGEPASRRGFLDWVAPLVATLSRKDGGRGVRFLSEPSGSPLMDTLRGRILERLPNARFVAWTPVSPANRYAGARLAFGRPLEPLHHFDKAKVVLSLDADFLEAKGPHLGHARAWAERRTPGASMSRLYVAEPSLTVTGSVADHRLRIRGSDIEALMRALATKGKPPLDEGTQAWVDAVRADLFAAGPEALVVVGDRQPPAVHALAHALHQELGAYGTTVTLTAPAVSDVDCGPEALQRLAGELRDGKVEALVVTAWNPGYAACADLDLQRLLRSTTTVYLGAYFDETSAAATWFVPRQHPLESWGDARALDGTVLFQQPLIEPLFAESMSEAQLYAAFAGQAETPPLELLKHSWMQRQGVPPADAAAAAGFDLLWSEWLRSGGIPSPTAPAESPALNLEAIAQAPSAQRIEGLELAFACDYKLHDGRGAGATWLLELPDPITKLVWDNAVLMSPKTAERLNLKPGLDGTAGWSHRSPKVALTVSGPDLTATVDAPVFVLPGHADDAVTLALGWGREGGEEVARGVGVDAYRLRQSTAPHFTRVELRALDEPYDLVTTQEHWSMDAGGQPRAIALEAKLGELEGLWERLTTLNGVPPTLQQPYDYSNADYRWGMAIDLNVCTGCSACVTACQAENNIPVVGKKGVWRNREMFWIRVDRYFTGDPDAPGVITQPVACQQCEAAPCEYVCPVAATSHSDEGLNDQVYNRCIGTRYCENNCPYKVRRFNYFYYTKDLKPLEQLAMNPDVTVRQRGVMEKCTFCIQRIERARIAHRREGRHIPDGAIQTACQQACPTQAIVFGSLQDVNSVVSQRHRDVRRYDLLHDLGTRPRNAYLVRIKNPNPELT